MYFVIRYRLKSQSNKEPTRTAMITANNEQEADKTAKAYLAGHYEAKKSTVTFLSVEMF